MKNRLSNKKAETEKSAFFDRPDFEIEKEYLSKGYKIIAGIDEAGRGSLAGPLSIGLTVFPESLIRDTQSSLSDIINDSKKLSHKKRLEALEIIDDIAFYSELCFISHKKIDESNINRATEYGIIEILKKLNPKPDLLLIDGNFSFKLDIPSIPVIKGDTRSISIAAASIIAKVKRDLLFSRFDELYPGYGFKDNMGYGTREHRDAILRQGICRIHRKSYEPAKSMLSGQTTLFE